MDRQYLDDIEHKKDKEILNKKTFSCSCTIFLQYVASMKITIPHYIRNDTKQIAFVKQYLDVTAISLRLLFFF